MSQIQKTYIWRQQKQRPTNQETENIINNWNNHDNGINSWKNVKGSVVNGTVMVTGTGVLATDATTGFLYIPSCAGTPTGTPEAYTGRCAMVFDTTNNKLYVYDGSWIDVT